MAGKIVKFSSGQAAGTIVIVNKDRKLYYVLGGGKAIQYPVAIGRTAQVWTGKTRISRKEKNPTWLNPDDPEAEVVPGGPDNPLGERALYLGATLYRIHGTPMACSIGQAVSNGCIRMYNKDVKDLYNRVGVGTKVVVTNSLTVDIEHSLPSQGRQSEALRQGEGRQAPRHRAQEREEERRLHQRRLKEEERRRAASSTSPTSSTEKNFTDNRA